jgi:4-hydroxy-tetrahydrodipicolinate synthase
MAAKRPMTQVPHGLIQCPITPFTADNKVDLDLFGRVVEFQMKQRCDGLGINLHIAESLNLDSDERKALVEAAVEAAAGRVPVIVNVSTPGTDQAVEFARHAEKAGADGILAISPYYWKPPAGALYEHFAAIISATGLPFIGYNSPLLMDGIGFTPDLLTRLMKQFPQFIGIKDASHNWDTFLTLGMVGRKIRPDFGMFVGVEWFIPSLTLGGVACMSILGGVTPKLIESLYETTKAGRLDEALPLQEKFAEIHVLAKAEYPAPTKAMWGIMGRPVGKPRLPNRPVSPEGIKTIEREFDRLGVFASEQHGW